MKLLIKLKYNGGGFSGYQVQQGRRTVQGELCRAADELFGHRCSVTGCSRTDAGVHAECFCATVTDAGSASLTTTIPISRVPAAFNTHLPPDIAVFDAAAVPDDFHPRYSVKEKTYIYRILNTEVRDPFFEGRAWFVNGVLLSAADIERMDIAASMLLGRHDFSSFMAAGSKIVDPVRTITRAAVREAGQMVEILVSADGFLYNMVRIIAGTLFDVGRGRTDPQDIPEIIEARRRSAAGVTAPPQGLYLHSVRYDNAGSGVDND